MSGDIHQRVERMLRALRCDIGAAECHGVLCGMLAVPAPFERDAWVRHVCGQDDVSPFDHGEPRAALSALVAHTMDALAPGSFAFMPLLPDDDQPLVARAEAFAAWCRGFLAGLGLAGIADPAVLGEDARGFLGDVARFAALDSTSCEDDEDERALSELIEFTRMGVLVVQAELGDRAEVFDPPPGLH
jgi:uncharacterized protein YgfB (UPF0149 family)